MQAPHWRRPLSFIALLIAPSCASHFPSHASRAPSRHVLVIGIDGCRPDSLQAASTPYLDGLVARGVVSYDAFAGGSADPEDATHQATSSGPGWASISTGVWVDKHGVSGNANFADGLFDAFPHFFQHVHDAKPDSLTSAIVQWHPIAECLLDPFPGLANFALRAEDSGRAVAEAAVAHLERTRPEVLFLHFDDVDHAGHASGYGADIRGYLNAIEQTDSHIGAVLSAIEAPLLDAPEDWLVIVTTDHGGLDRGHGGHSPDERRIFFITSGGATPNGVVSTASPGHTAVPPTVLTHLGIRIEDEWGFASEPFGLE